MNKVFSYGADAFSLKMLALIFMVIDHIHTYLNLGPEWISILPRFVAPLFVFFLVEGFFNTRNINAYFQRILLFAVIMLTGNIAINLIFNNTDILTGKLTFYSIVSGNNIFLTLAVFLYILICIYKIRREKVASKKIFMIIFTAIFMFLSLFCEGGIYLLPLLIIFYVFHGNKKYISVGVIIWSVFIFIKAIFNYFSGATGLDLFSTLCFNSEWAMIFALFPILLYNGKRGRNDAFAKWIFYFVYPIHLWILRSIYLIFIK